MFLPCLNKVYDDDDHYSFFGLGGGGGGGGWAISKKNSCTIKTAEKNSCKGSHVMWKEYKTYL